MSGPYLKKLRALRSQKGILEAPPKHSKRSPSVAVAPTATAVEGFDGFEGARSSRFPDFLGRYRRVVAALEARCPYRVPVARWQQVITDGTVFLRTWGAQAEALGWSDADLFGLPPVPEQPHPSFTRLARYDLIGLCWLLQSREVVALTATSAAIMNTSSALTAWRRPPVERGDR